MVSKSPRTSVIPSPSVLGMALDPPKWLKNLRDSPPPLVMDPQWTLGKAAKVFWILKSRARKETTRDTGLMSTRRNWTKAKPKKSRNTTLTIALTQDSIPSKSTKIIETMTTLDTRVSMDLTPSVGTAPILTTGIVMMIIATNITIILPNFPRTRTNFPWMHMDVLVQLGEK